MFSDSGPREIAQSDARIRCLLAHDHVLLRQGVRRLLEDEPDIDVVGEAGNAAECLRKLQELQPDLVVMGAGTFDLPAPEAEQRVALESPRTKTVFLSAQDPSTARSAEMRSAKVLALRQTSAEELVGLVRGACGGNCGDALRPENGVPPAAAHSPQERALTMREREVLKLLAEGKTVRAAAGVLGLSVKTVDAHKFNLMRKVGLHNKAELVMWAIQKKIVKIPVNF